MTKEQHRIQVLLRDPDFRHGLLEFYQRFPMVLHALPKGCTARPKKHDPRFLAQLRQAVLELQQARVYLPPYESIAKQADERLLAPGYVALIIRLPWFETFLLEAGGRVDPRYAGELLATPQPIAGGLGGGRARFP